MAGGDPFGYTTGSPDSDWSRNLMQFGLATMAAANQRDASGFLTYGPGALGAIGAGGLQAMQGARENTLARAQMQDIMSQSAGRNFDNRQKLMQYNLWAPELGMPQLDMTGNPSGQQDASGTKPAPNLTGYNYSQAAGGPNNQPQPVAPQGGGQSPLSSLFAAPPGVDQAQWKKGIMTSKFVDPEAGKQALALATAKAMKQAEYGAVPQTIDTSKPTILNGQLVAGQDASGTPFINPAGFTGQAQGSSATQDSMLNFIMNDLEGGDKVVSDGHGLAKFGINTAANPGVDIQSLTADQAKEIYKNRYVAPLGIDNMSPAAQLVAIDTSVNHGPDVAKALIQKTGGDPLQMMQARAQMYNQLAQSDPQKYGPQLKGWQNRLVKLSQQADVVSGQGQARQASFEKPASLPPGAIQAGPNPIEHKAQEAEATKRGEVIADSRKTLEIMDSNLSALMQRLQEMRNAVPNADYGFGVDNEGTGFQQQLSEYNPAKASANHVLLQKAAQGVLPELGPQLVQAGVKGNKFLETLASSASGMDMAANPKAKQGIINGLEAQYVRNLKSTAAQLRSYGYEAPSDEQINQRVDQIRKQIGTQSPEQVTALSLKSPHEIGEAYKAGKLPKEEALRLLRANHGM